MVPEPAVSKYAAARRWTALVVCSIGMITMLSVTAPGHAHADAELDVSMTPAVEPTIWLEDTSLDIVVSNPGTEPLSAVDVTVSIDSVIRFASGIVTGPVVMVGDDDSVLAPGEQWAYEAVVATALQLVVEVTATATDTSVVTASGTLRLAEVYPTSLLYPVDLSIVPGVTIATPGQPFRFTVTARNITTFPIVELFGEQRLLYPGRTGPMPYTALGAPVDQGDGDEVLDPGETWRWEVDAVVETDESYLDVAMGVRRGDVDERYDSIGITRQSDPVRLGTTPTTQPTATTEPTETSQPTPTGPEDVTLPSTGAGSRSTSLGVLLTISGIGLVALGRSRPGTRSAGRNP